MSKNTLLSILLLFCSAISCTSFNDISKTAQQTANSLKGVDNAVKAAKGLATSLKMSKTEFDKTVKVFQSGDAATKRNSVPSEKLAQFEIKKGKTQNLEWQPVAHFENQLFPSVIVSMATYKEPVVGSFAKCIKSSALGFSFLGQKSYLPFKYEIECVEKKYFDKVSGEFIYQKAGETEFFMPEIPWNFEVLTKQVTNKPIQIYYRIFDDKGNKSEKILSVTMRSIDDCIFAYNNFNMTFMFAAYVQEQHPEIDKILREALNTKMVSRWIGYQARGTEVDKQIAAIWRVLHDRGFVYSSILSNAGDKGEVVSQAVRTFDSALKTNQANCVDGTIVFASILKRIGITPLLVIVPGHCFLGYYTTDTETRQLKFLETTMLGESGNLTKIKSPLAKNKEYNRLFKIAQQTAMSEFVENKTKYYVNLVNVETERERVGPIPYYP